MLHITHGLAAKWKYLSQTISDIADFFQPLEDIIHQHFLPTLTYQNSFSDSIWALTALPTQLGGLGITNRSGNLPIPFWLKCPSMLAHINV